MRGVLQRVKRASVTVDGSVVGEIEKGIMILIGVTDTDTEADADYIAEMTAWVAQGGQTTLEGFRALDADSREGVLDYLSEMTLYEEANVKGKNYILMSCGIANYDPDTDLEDYEPEDFFAEDATAPEIEGAIVVVGGEPTKSGKIEREGNTIRINCAGKLACLCLENGKEFYV